MLSIASASADTVLDEVAKKLVLADRSVTALHVESCGLTMAAFNAMAIGFVHWQTLTSVTLIDLPVSEENLRNLVVGMESLHMTALELCQTGLTSAHVPSLVAFLHKHRSTLQKLYLPDNAIGSTGVVLFAKELCAPGYPELSLVLAKNGIDHVGMEALASRSMPFYGVDVSDNPLGMGGLAALAGWVMVAPIRKLSVRRVLPSGIGILLDALKQASGVEKLSLTGVPLSGEHIILLPTLVTLQLSSCALTDVEVAALSKELATNATLTTLDISRNSFGDTGWAALSAALSSNGCLQKIDLSGNTMSLYRVNQLALAIAQNRSLKTIELRNVGIQTDLYWTLAVGAAGNPVLTMVSTDLPTDAIEVCYLNQTARHAGSNERGGAQITTTASEAGADERTGNTRDPSNAMVDRTRMLGHQVARAQGVCA